MKVEGGVNPWLQLPKNRALRLVCRRDYERTFGEGLDDKERPNMNVVNWQDKDYSLLTIHARIGQSCSLIQFVHWTNMQYVVSHGMLMLEDQKLTSEGVLHKTCRWIPGEIGRRTARSDSVSSSSNMKKSI